MSRTIFHVAPAGGTDKGFSVRRRGSNRRLFTGTKRAAVAEARTIAGNRRGNAQIIIHDRAGRFAGSILVG